MKRFKTLICLVLVPLILLANTLPGLAAIDPAVFEKEQRILQYEREKLTLVKEIYPAMTLWEIITRKTKVDWSIWQGQAAFLTDEEFLKLVGDEEKFKKVRATKRRVMLIDVGLATLGIGSLLATLSISDSEDRERWGKVVAGGVIVGGLGWAVYNAKADRRGISPEQAASIVEKYNQNLMDKLSLTPEDLAY